MFAENMLGINVGNNNMGFALIKQQKVPYIIKSAVEETPMNCMVDGEVRDLELMALKIKEVISNRRLKAKKISFCINSPQAVIREFKLPALKDSELHEAVELNLSQTFPGIAQTHTISFKVHSRSKEMVTGIASLCPNKILESFINLGQLVGIPLKYVDVSANCIAKTYNTFIRNDKINGNVLIVDIGHSSSRVNIIAEEKLILSRNVSVGSSSINKLVSNLFNISLENAEKEKISQFKKYMLQGHDVEQFIRQSYAPIEQEIKQTINFYNQSGYEEKISRIILIGGGSLQWGIEHFFSESFKIPTSVIRPIDSKSLYINEFNKLIPAIGAALREG